MGARAPAPGAGAATAVVAALAAGLCAMTARASSRQIADAPALAERADTLASSMAVLADADARAYGRVLTELAPSSREVPEARSGRVEAALSAAADVPLAVARGAAEVAEMAAELCSAGNPKLVGEARASALLAEAAARSAAVLVELNLSGAPGDGRPRAARAVAEIASAAARRAESARARGPEPD